MRIPSGVPAEEEFDAIVSGAHYINPSAPQTWQFAQQQEKF